MASLRLGRNHPFSSAHTQFTHAPPAQLTHAPRPNLRPVRPGADWPDPRARHPLGHACSLGADWAGPRVSPSPSLLHAHALTRGTGSLALSPCTTDSQATSVRFVSPMPSQQNADNPARGSRFSFPLLGLRYWGINHGRRGLLVLPTQCAEPYPWNPSHSLSPSRACAEKDRCHRNRVCAAHQLVRPLPYDSLWPETCVERF